MYLQYNFQLHRQKNRLVKHESESTVWNQLTNSREGGGMRKVSGEQKKGLNLFTSLKERLQYIYIYIYLCNNTMFTINVLYIQIQKSGVRGVGFPGGTVVKNLPARAGDAKGFDLCVGKIPWSRKWQPNPVFLSGKFHGQRNLAGYSP